MKKNDINIIESIHEFLELTGNPYLVEIFNKYRDDEENLYIALKNYIRGLYYEIHEEEEDEEGQSEEKKGIPRYIYLNGVVIDAGNIARIELDSNYNPKKNNYNYFIKIVKKYPSPLEEEYIIPFDSEEQRDKGYDILKGKLKLCNLFII